MSDQQNTTILPMPPAVPFSTETVEALTDAPTVAPTETPTVEPTAQPSPTPTAEPVVYAEDELIVESPADTISKKLQNVTQDVEVFVEEPNWNPSDEILPTPSLNTEDSLRAIETTSNISFSDTVEARKWGSVFERGQEHVSFEDSYKSTIENKEADFSQSVKSESGVFAGAYPKFQPTDAVTSGEMAVLRMMSHLNMGAIFQVPLWHTGIYITLKAPGEVELLELQRQMASDKILFGRASYGLLFSNNSSYLYDRLVSFALSHMYQTTLKEAQDLKDIISCHDYPAIIWGMTCAIYPRGVQHTRACVTNPEKCKHIVEERLNVSKLLWTNRAALTESQRKHMSQRRTNSMSLDSVKRYQEEMINSQKREIIVNETSDRVLKILLKIPTLSEFIDSGNTWIGDITTMVNQALGIDAKDDVRNAYIFKQGQATAMRQYIHWVESIEYDGNKIEDRATLDSTFNALSTDDIIRNEFITKVSEYINDTAITVIGIPEYDCPKCGELQKSPMPKQTNIIPMDVTTTFFTLLGQKLQRLTRR